MNIVEIIDKKTKKEELTKQEIEYFVANYTAGEIKDYQAAALLIAIKINGMTEAETMYLTEAMVKSGKTLDLSGIDSEIFDKHSTGGVGDKVTLILIPILVSLGFRVAKMSGRGLGFTGGTVDKLESIPGFEIELSIEKFMENVRKNGMSIISQSEELAPADRKIYKLRDTIAATDSIPLITSSIMSKKIASGANNIILDVTYGSGAFMKTYEEALKLKKLMEKVGNLFNINVISEITKMQQPLGYCIGNSLEVLEAMAFLNGQMAKDLKNVVYKLVEKAVISKDKNAKPTEIREKIDEIIKDKTAYKNFLRLITNQNGDIIKFKELVQKQNNKQNAYKMFAKKSGKIERIDALCIAKASFKAGAGRERKEDEIDYFSGIVLNKKSGEYIAKDEPIAYLFLGEYITEKLKRKGLKIEDLIEEIEKNLQEGIIINE